jgi:polysaccharide biosynthesis protein PslG
MGSRRLTLLLALVLVVAGIAAGPADAAKRKVPFGFFGATVHHTLFDPRVPDPTIDQQMALMARSGVESIRVTFAWEQLEPSAGTYDLSRVDRLMAAAARHRIVVILNVTATPQWASTQPAGDFWRNPPRDPSLYANLMRLLAQRYGPRGTFWAENPSLPREPVRRWQIWNEQMAPWHWEPQPWARGYTQLLRLTYQAIHGVDRGAKVIAGSLVAAGTDGPWDGIRDLYRAGGKRYFDVVAVHPFTNDPRSAKRTIDNTVEIVRRVRTQMRRFGDRRKPIFLTEMTWPASVGKIPRSALLGLETTSKGQVKRLKAAYARFARLRSELRVTEAHWYSWSSEYNSVGAESVMSFRYVGLVRSEGELVFRAMPLLGTYKRLAARYQGCRKSANARRCR